MRAGSLSLTTNVHVYIHSNSTKGLYKLLRNVVYTTPWFYSLPRRPFLSELWPDLECRPMRAGVADTEAEMVARSRQLEIFLDYVCFQSSNTAEHLLGQVRVCHENNSRSPTIRLGESTLGRPTELHCRLYHDHHHHYTTTVAHSRTTEICLDCRHLFNYASRLSFFLFSSSQTPQSICLVRYVDYEFIFITLTSARPPTRAWEVARTVVAPPSSVVKCL